MSRIGIGVIGVGAWGQFHARTYAEHPSVELIAVADVNVKRAKEIAKTYGAKKYFADYRDLLRDPRVEAVSVAVPDPYHKEPCLAAAEAGKHILVEKPLATTLEDAEAIVRAAEKAKVKLMVDFHNRWNPPFVVAKNIIDKDEIGNLLYVNLRLNDAISVPMKMLKWASKSSVVWFLGSHAADITRWLMKDEPATVTSFARSKVLVRKGIDTPDLFHSVIEYRRGGLSAIENQWILPETFPSLYDFNAELVGTKGTLFIDTSQNRCIQKFAGRKCEYPDVLAVPIIHGRLTGFAKEAISHFVDCVASNNRPMVTGEDGIQNTKTVLAMIESAKREKSVEIQD